jgi:hypothetical protein
MQIVEDHSQGGSDGQVLHPGSRKLFRYWEMLRAERPCPNREDFELSAVTDLVPDLFILERDHMRDSFRYRLAGTRLCELQKQNLTGGDALSGWETFERNVIYKHMLQTLSNFQPALVRARYATDNNQQIATEMLVLPLRMRGSQRVQLLGGNFAFTDARRFGHTAIVGRDLLSARVVWTEYQESLQSQSKAERPRFSVIEGGLASRPV